MNQEFCLFQVNKKRVIWEVTKFCNYHCKHCCASAEIIDTKDELKLDNFIKALDEMKEYGVEEIYFSGGEPFSRKDILQILKKAVDNGIKCNISTNGSLITENIAKELKKLNINKVHISLDHYDKEKFNSFRGGEYFEPTINAIRLLKDNNIYVRVGAVIWKENVKQIEEMIQYLINLNVDEVVFNWLIKVGRLTKNEDVCVNISEFDSTINKIRELKKKYEKDIKVSMHRSCKFEDSNQICPGGEDFFYISPEGKLAPCSWIKKMDKDTISKNSLKEKSFLEIVKEDNFKKFNNMKNERKEKYKTGCPAICFERNNTYFSKDPLLLEKEEKYGKCSKCMSV